MVNGVAVESQTTKTLHYMQTVARIQTQVQSRNRVKEEEEQAVQRHQRQKFEKKPDKLKVRMGFISLSWKSFYTAHDTKI